MKQYSDHQLDKARRKEEVILRLTKGESLVNIVPDYPDIPLTSATWYRLKKRYRETGLEALVDKRKGLSYKARPEIRRFIADKKEATQRLSCAELVSLVREKFGLKISNSLISHILKKEGIRSRRGRRPLSGQKSFTTLAVCPGKDKIDAKIFNKPCITILNPKQYMRLELGDMKIIKHFKQYKLGRLKITLKIAEAQLIMRPPVTQTPLALRVALVFTKKDEIVPIVTNIDKEKEPDIIRLVEAYFQAQPSLLKDF